MFRAVTQQLAGWGGFPRQAGHVYRPDSPAEVPALLREVPESLIPWGQGRSYGDAALNEGRGVVRTERMNRLLSWDPATSVLECEAGVTFDDLIRTFLPRGAFPPVTPGTQFVSLGGALAADVHGKNHHHDGTIANCVEQFQLLTGRGELLTCSREENPEVFWATLGGLGLTGMILRVRLRLRHVESAWVRVRYRRAANLDQALNWLQEGHAARYSVAWIDCLSSGADLGRSVLMEGDHAPVDALPVPQRATPLVLPQAKKRRVPFHFPGWALNSWTVRLFNGRYYARHVDGEKVVPLDTFFHPLDAVRDWNRIYGRRGFVQYQMVLPPASSRAGLVEILERISQSRRASFLAVLKLFGAANPGPLSFPCPGATLALDLPCGGSRLLALLDELDQIVIKHGGRVYLAKDARLSRSAFEAMYPRADEFRTLMTRLDPAGRFDSSLARRLGLSRQVVGGTA